MRKRIGFTGLLIAAMLSPIAANGSDYPNKPITMVVPFSAGGPSDANARVVARAISAVLGQPIIIDNRAGASGIMGTDLVARAKPDGYTIMYASSGPIATNPHLYINLPYDPLKSFAYVHALAQAPMVLVVNAARPYKTFAEFIEFAKRNPKRVNFATGGQGTAGHLAMELLQKEAGIEVTQIPYKGSGPAMADLAGGALDALIDYPNIAQPFVDAAKVKILAVSSEARLNQLPDTPSMKELGYPAAVFTGFSAVAAPIGIPDSVNRLLASAIAKALNDQEVLRFYENNGAVLMPAMNGQQLLEFVRKENEKIRDLVSRAGIVAQ